MKKSFFIIAFVFAFLLCAQAQDMSGRYIKEIKHEDGIYIKYELTLSKNGSFKFHFYQDQLCYEDDDVVMGNWKLIKEVVVLNPKKEETTDDVNILKLKNTKVKIIDNNTFQIYNSETTWLNEIVLEKQIK